MRLLGSLRFGPAFLIIAALASASFLVAHAPTARAQCGTDASAAPCPTPTPIPVNAFLSIDPTAGDTTAVINVSGGQFLPNQQMNLYWDQAGHVAGFAVTDAGGNIVPTKVKPFPGDGPGAHKLCASVQPNPCAFFTINATASPTPSPSPSESPSPSSSPEPVVTTLPSPSPVASLSGFDVISRPPFVFLPIAGFLGIALSLGYWLVSLARRPRQRALPTAAVMHRATRPDYTASFGTPPPAPALGMAQSAWDEPVTAHEPEAATSPTPPPAAEPDAPPVEWGLGTPDTGYPELSSPEEPPELPEHGDLPEPGD
jgi:hypothetical protein